MAFPLDRSTYVKVGEAKGLEFLDELAPATVYDKCNWRCGNCGLVYNKTYRAVYLGKHGCRCQNGMSMSVEKYTELEQKFNIELIHKANNYKQPSKWYSPVTGNTVMASYYQIQYAPLKNIELLAELGINIVETRGRPEIGKKRVRRHPLVLTPDSTEEERELVHQKSDKLTQRHFKEVSKHRLLNQEEEQGILEIYD